MIPRLLVGLLVMNLTVAAQGEAIHLEIMEGDGAINNIRSSHTKEPVVRVEDANNRGVPGAVVTFLVPSDGPGVVFADAATSLTLTTDDRGEVVPRGLHPNRNVGPFQIRVTASAHGMTANAAISQTNVDPGSHTSSRKIVILAAVGGAAAAGVALALRGGKSSSTATTSANSSGTVVIPGNPSLGGPQ
jgi:hypothetical protein